MLLSMALLAPVGVQTADDFMIGGVILGGSTNLTLVAVRAPTRPEEAAVFPTLAPGYYTAVVAGKGGATGIGLVDVYNIR